MSSRNKHNLQKDSEEDEGGKEGGGGRRERREEKRKVSHHGEVTGMWRAELHLDRDTTSTFINTYRMFK